MRVKLKGVNIDILQTYFYFTVNAVCQHNLTLFYCSTGRPSIDPELMILMLLLGHVMGIRSERRLCEEVYLNLVYRWFCRLDLGDGVPDYS